MEKRAILAFGLSAALLFLYVWMQDRYFSPPPAERQAAEQRRRAEERPAPDRQSPKGAPAPAPEAPRASPATPAAVSTAPAAAATGSPARTPRPPQRTAVVNGPLYRAVVSSEGGKLQEWTLKYRGEKPMVVVGDLGPGGLRIGDGAAVPGEPIAMTIGPDSLSLSGSEPVGRIVLNGEENGLNVRETLTFRAQDYTVEAAIRIENGGKEARTVSVALPWSSRQHWEGIERFIGQRPTEVVWSSGGAVDRFADLGAVPHLEKPGEWIGLDSIWYLSALIPKSPGLILVALGDKAPGNGKQPPTGKVTVEVRAAPTIDPGQAWDGQVAMYIGPKEYERLRALGLEESLNFGGFPVARKWGGLPMEWLGVPILLLMKWVYRYVGNYGLAIILLTVVTRVLFYPLTVKSMRSMKAMQALQPQVNALRAKYKSDPQRLQRETMELYRKYKVNPMGGCLPMVAQIPIFYALYLALSVSVELQSATFLCFGRIFGVDVWICDLASHDPTYVLPLLMGVTMFMQQKMSPTTGDPRQARMMLVMPFVFTFMFLNLPSGLVLYWTVSNVLQVLQQWYMDRPRARAAREAKNASRV
jgi:YidC/Oxa1 family membrane protein insertase